MLKKFTLSFILENGLLGLCLLAYMYRPFAEMYMTPEMKIELSDSIDTFFWLKWAYFIYMPISAIVCYRRAIQGRKTKLENVFLHVVGVEKSDKVNHDVRVLILKFFFIPLMLPFTIDAAVDFYVLATSEYEFKSIIDFINSRFYLLMLYGIGLAAYGIYAFGYIVESKALKSEIKSVDDNWVGWLVCLMCYAPFFGIISAFIPMQTGGFEFYKSTEITAGVRIFLTVIMSLKLWAIVSLGPKSSNLTNRGIITTGPYKYIRHPHYLAKLIFWWIGFVPYFIYNYWAIVGMVFWTFIYIMRAITEENHLMKDGEYKSYADNVKWRFIPGVY